MFVSLPGDSVGFFELRCADMALLENDTAHGEGAGVLGKGNCVGGFFSLG